MKTIYVQLGRAGDVFNVLPLCRLERERTGEAPGLMVAAPYRPLLDGVSYVRPLVYEGRFEEVRQACCLAESLRAGLPEEQRPRIVCTQIYGDGLYSSESCSSFVRESWDRDPRAPAWGSLPLEFDRRDPERERAVTDQVLSHGTGKPFVILALNGTSSPFERAFELSRLLRSELADYFDVFDLSGFAAPRFFDVLGLLERAEWLVTVDSGWLHLAHAVPSLKVAAFITREPSRWHGTAWRPQQRARFYYDEAPECFPELVAEINDPTTPVIHHAWSHFEAGGIDAETRRRIAFARSTWVAERATGRWVEREFAAKDARRSSSDAPVLDPRPVPYMRDVIGHAARGASSRDVLAFTNADVCFAPGLTGWVLDAVRRHGAAHTHRWDFHRPLDRPLVNEAAVKRGEWYPGSDAFFFSRRWWDVFGREYPDMIIGREQNDEVLRQLIKRGGGVEIPGAIYHEKHPSYWEHHGNRETNPGNLYNKALARKWFLKTGLRPNDPEWWKI